MRRPSFKLRHLYIVLLCFMFFPLIEGITNIVKLKPLEGAVVKSYSSPRFSAENWLNNVYQPEREYLANDSFGFRSECVRIRNQVDFSLFGIAHTQNFAMGKKGYLYETHYIDGYYGTDFLGDGYINQTMKKLEFINDTLNKLNKTLLIVIAPSKALFYPEYLPDAPSMKKGPTNYDTYLDLIKKSGIHYIDFNSYFIEDKYKSKYLLEPKNGVHWSMYGAAIAGDSLTRYIESVRHITMPRAVWKKTDISRGTMFDIDIENSLNLFFKLSGPLMAYPEIKFEKDSTKTRPNVLVIGDSFYWGLVGSYDIGDGFSASSKFWYYFKNPDHTNVTRHQVKEELNKNDIIILLATTPNMATIGWGFIDTTYNMLKNSNTPHPLNAAAYSEKIKEIKEKIMDDKNWMEQIKEGAKEKGITIDSALTLNAIWMFGQEKN